MRKDLDFSLIQMLKMLSDVYWSIFKRSQWLHSLKCDFLRSRRKKLTIFVQKSDTLMQVFCLSVQASHFFWWISHFEKKLCKSTRCAFLLSDSSSSHVWKLFSAHMYCACISDSWFKFSSFKLLVDYSVTQTVTKRKKLKYSVDSHDFLLSS